MKPWVTTKFQFHNGSIKSIQNTKHKTQKARFQFHNGSIKRVYFPFLNNTYLQFQFHNGSIKSYINAGGTESVN